MNLRYKKKNFVRSDSSGVFARRAAVSLSDLMFKNIANKK